MKKLFSLFFCALSGLSHATDILNLTDQDFYDEGMRYQKAQLYQEAKKCFSAVVFSQDIKLSVKAQYNLGYISYHQSRLEDAMLWFLQSNNMHIASYGSVFKKSFRALKRLRKGSIDYILSGKNEVFSTPHRDICDLFSRVEFSNLPRWISLKNSFTVTGGDLEIHFRDAEHLRSIMTATPLFSGKKVYYVRNQKVQDGQEFRAIGGRALREKFVHVEAEEGITVRGYMPYIPFKIVFPKGAILKMRSLNCELIEENLSSLENTQKLIECLEEISDETIGYKRERALDLLAERYLDRKLHPENYMSLEDLAPNRAFFGDAVIEESPRDYVDSQEKPFYVGPHRAALEDLEKEIPIHEGLFLVDPSLSFGGLYTKTPLKLTLGFKVCTSGNLIVSGKLPMTERFLELVSGKNMWIIGAHIEALFVSANPSRGRVGFLSLLRPINIMERPKGMPDVLWNAFCHYHRW